MLSAPLAELVHSGTRPPHPGASGRRRTGSRPWQGLRDGPTETLRCGCDVYPADLHDVHACLEALADEFAYLKELRSSRDEGFGMAYHARSRAQR
jgi:hypothetical protein